MKIESRDRRALLMLGGALLVTAIVIFWPAGSGDVVRPSGSSVPTAERRLERLRELVATVPGKQKLLDGVMAQLKVRERSLIEADTAAQAQAQLSQVIRKLMRAQTPPMETGQVELSAIQPLGKDYGEALVTIGTNCRIEQLVNLMADVSRQPEAIATRELRVMAGDARQKTLSVRLTISGVLPRRLVPVADQRRSQGGNLF
jgi:Type II secretion system (T2SS), protein M subtype b